MPIATSLALGLGAAAIGAGASVVAAGKNSKAINKATDAQTASNDKSVALQGQIYNQNFGVLNPYAQRGNAAGDQINALLGLPTPQTAQMPSQAFAQPAFGPQPATLQPSRSPSYAMSTGGSLNNMVERFRPGYEDGAIDENSAIGLPTPQQAYQVVGQPSQSATQQPAQQQGNPQANAFDVFRNSTGYQFRLGQGNDSINSAYGAAGTLQSGAALKALARYNQDFASNEFGNYMGYLGQQQGVGLGAGSALAGVGQSYANNVTQLNGQQANSLSNAAIAKANNTNALIGGIGSSIGGALGYFAGGSSYGR